MPKAVLLSPYLDSYLALLARCGERIPLILSPAPLGKSYPPPAALTLTPSPAGLPQAGCSGELGPVHGLLPPFLMLIRAGSGEHVWNQVPRRAPSSLILLFHAKEDVAGFASERCAHSININRGLTTCQPLGTPR